MKDTVSKLVLTLTCILMTQLSGLLMTILDSSASGSHPADKLTGVVITSTSLRHLCFHVKIYVTDAVPKEA